MWKIQQSVSGEDELPNRTAQVPVRSRSILMWIESIVLGLGFVLLGIYGAALFESVLDSRAFLRRFASLDLSPDSQIRNSSEGDHEANANPHGEESAEGHARVPSNRRDMPLAVLQIPKIHLAAPLLDGTDAFTLNHAVGRIAGTAWPGGSGNLGIAGHRDSFFRGLKDIKTGDAIKLETLKGTDTYIVDQIQIVTPDDVGVLRPRPVPSLTLVTCYPFYFIGSAPKRYIVKASLTRQTVATPEDPGRALLSQTGNSIRGKQ
jgi:sortase A